MVHDKQSGNDEHEIVDDRAHYPESYLNATFFDKNHQKCAHQSMKFPSLVGCVDKRNTSNDGGNDKYKLKINNNACISCTILNEYLDSINDLESRIVRICFVPVQVVDEIHYAQRQQTVMRLGGVVLLSHCGFYSPLMCGHSAFRERRVFSCLLCPCELVLFSIPARSHHSSFCIFLKIIHRR